MIIIIGLGNPGRNYKKTRHNIGFRIIDKFKEKNKFPKFQLSKKFSALISGGIFDNKKIILAKPQTFMNQSGKAVKALISFYKNSNLIVIHDDIDLLLGNIKIIKNRGSAGHKGIESIIKETGSKNFIRLRNGIQSEKQKLKTVEEFVLQKFNKEEEKIIKKVLNTANEALEAIISQGLEKTMNKYNT